MLQWLTDTIVAGRIVSPQINIIVDASLLLAAKQAGESIKEEFATFRESIESRYPDRIRFGWAESASGHVIVIEHGVER